MTSPTTAPAETDDLAAQPTTRPGTAKQRAPESLQGPVAFIQALLQDFGGYLLSLGLLGLGGLLLLPMITARLSPADLGLYSLVDTALTQGLTLGLLGLKFSYLYFYAHGPAEERPQLLGNTLLISALGSLAVGSLTALLFGSATIMAWFDAAPLPMAWLLVPLLVTGALQVVLMTELRAARHVTLTGVFAVTQLALLLGSSWWLVVERDYGLSGILIAQLMAQGVATLAPFLLLLPRLQFDFDPARSRKLLRYGLPMMGGLTLRYALDTISRFLLAAMVSIEAAGLFLVANRITMLFEALLATPFLMAFGGLVHHALRQPDAVRILGRISSVTLAVSALFALLMLALREPLFVLLAHDAMPQAGAVFVLLLLSRLVLTVRSPLTAGLLRDSNTSWATSNSALALILFLALVWPATHIAGAAGAACALLAANLLAVTRLGLIAWPHCRQRLQPQALLLGGLLLCASMATLAFGDLPAAIWAILLLVATVLAAHLVRHLHVPRP